MRGRRSCSRGSCSLLWRETPLQSVVVVEEELEQRTSNVPSELRRDCGRQAHVRQQQRRIHVLRQALEEAEHRKLDARAQVYSSAPCTLQANQMHVQMYAEM